ncbi:hypothetical protein [Kerstersia similis]|uniref:hypothetical protein n=1 Tax=Kerstersia similis TaxID=206505 RepID=UPI0039EF8FA4
MSNTIRAAYQGNEKLLAVWKTAPQGPLYDLTKSAVQQVESVWIRQGMIEADERRSALAKREDKTAVSREALPTLANLRQKLANEQKKLDARAGKLSPVEQYREGDHATVQIDLEMARLLRGMPPSERSAALSQAGDLRLRDAVLRLPGQLTGISVEKRAQLEQQAIEQRYPQEAAEIAETRIAMGDAIEAVQRAWAAVGASVPLADRIEAAGDAEIAVDLEPGTAPDTVKGIHARHSSD